MAKYYRRHGETRKRKLLRLLRPVVVFMFVVSIAIIGYLVYDIYSQGSASETASQLSAPVSSTIIANKEIHTSPYFQFQTPERWRAVANETREGHYVYRQFNGALVEQELTIDINNQLPELLATTQISRVLPMKLSAKGFDGVATSELAHCKKATKPGTEKTQQIVTMYGVTFPCNPTSTSYDVVFGSVGGTNIMQLNRPSGEAAYYKIFYRNVTANPNSRDLLGIAQTFETR